MAFVEKKSDLLKYLFFICFRGLGI